MVESAEHRDCDDVEGSRVTSGASNGAVAQGLMATTAVVVRRELAKDFFEVPFSEHDDIIKALAAERSVDAFDETILPGRPRCRLDGFDAIIANAVVELWTKDLVPIVNQKSWLSTVTRKCLSYLAECPDRCGIRRHVEVDDATSVMAQNHKTVEELEERGRDDDEITSGSDLHVVSQKGHPSLTRSS